MGARLALASLLVPAVAGGHRTGLEAIDERELVQHVVQLSAAPLEGRDSPSAGLDRAAEYIEARFGSYGLVPVADGVAPEGDAGGGSGFRWSFSLTAQRAVPEASSLVLAHPDGETIFEFGGDFVPVAGASGEASGELAFAGYGIDSSKERYNDLRGALKGKVALILEGEPRHRRKFDGEEVTGAAGLYGKLKDLERKGVVGVLVARRPPDDPGVGKLKVDLPAPARLGFRHTWAQWLGEDPGRTEPVDVPALEISLEAGSRLLGRDLEELARSIDKRAKPVRVDVEGRSVRLASASTRTAVSVDNVVGVLVGNDAELADEFVVLGAHYDHVGVDVRGRIGFGADDNASGTAVLLEVLEALAAAGPRRSVLACAFAAEEDGLLGSRALCEDLPVPADAIVAMINLDMVGRGETDEVAVLGTRQNPDLADVVERANDLSRTRIEKLVLGKGRELFERSDHYSFHQVGIPAVFFFEGLPISRNEDYHTWRDTADKLDFEKMERTARLVYNTAWLLCTDDERPASPRD